MLTNDQMTATFSPLREPYRPLLGFEYEIQCFDKVLGLPLPYEGPGGLKDILTAAASSAGGTLRGAPGDPLTKVDLPDGALLSLEPGGQLEFSSSPKGMFGEVVEQFYEFLALHDELQRSFDFHCFFGGANPVHTVDQIGLITSTHRYMMMSDYFPKVGSMGLRMMRQTCSVQVTFDYRDHVQGQDLLRTALYIAPFAAAMFSNSPYLDGRRTPYKSNRVPIWANTDPSRCGLLPGFTRPDYDFDHYLSHVTRAPMFFVNTDDGVLVPARGMTFEQFNHGGFEGKQATVDDFLLHNSTIFTDVRLKHTVEVRSVDGQDPLMLPAVLALLSGILFCQRSRLRARHLLESLSLDYTRLPDQLGRQGLSGTVGGMPVRDIALELIDLAAKGLPTCFPDGADAVQYLDPLRELARKGKTPADVVVERFGDDAAAWLEAGRTF